MGRNTTCSFSNEDKRSMNINYRKVGEYSGKDKE